jgi:hypothetical protein
MNGYSSPVIAKKRPSRPPIQNYDKKRLLKKLKKQYIETKMNMLEIYPGQYNNVTDIELVDILNNLEAAEESLDIEETQEKWNEQLKHYKDEFE